MITNHSWVFGDGSTSTASSPSHTYSIAGAYSVILTVSGSGSFNTLEPFQPDHGDQWADYTADGTRYSQANGMLYPTLTNLTITVVASVIVNDGGG